MRGNGREYTVYFGTLVHETSNAFAVSRNRRASEYFFIFAFCAPAGGMVRGHVALCVVTLVALARPGAAGILEWGRSNHIEVNIPWLPCEYTIYIHIYT